jgi:hypothetical protein
MAESFNAKKETLPTLGIVAEVTAQVKAAGQSLLRRDFVFKQLRRLDSD